MEPAKRAGGGMGVESINDPVQSQARMANLEFERFHHSLAAGRDLPEVLGRPGALHDALRVTPFGFRGFSRIAAFVEIARGQERNERLD